MPASTNEFVTGKIMPSYDSLPYRPCVGVMVLNPTGHAFIGRRIGGPEHTDDGHQWQMPQGGVDPGEDTYKAALRELYEETSIRSVEKLGEISDWLALRHHLARGAGAREGQ